MASRCTTISNDKVAECAFEIEGPLSDGTYTIHIYPIRIPPSHLFNLRWEFPNYHYGEQPLLGWRDGLGDVFGSPEVKEKFKPSVKV